MSVKKRHLAIIFATAIIALSVPASAGVISGQVVDSATGKPIKGALVTIEEKVITTDGDGLFSAVSVAKNVSFRAYGYLREQRAATGPLYIKLRPFKPKALYLSFFGIGNNRLRDSALALIRDTELNALVIDVKGDRGWVPYNSSVSLARLVGAQRLIMIKDMDGLIATLKAQGIYTVARIVAFKDSPLATARPDLAVKTSDGSIWRDRENLAWTDPFNREAWEYNIDIAEEAARLGFDEIQFDYVRFPDADGLRFSRESNEANRVEAINGFLAEARKRLVKYNVFLAADIFGYVLWNKDDTGIGQRLEDIAPTVDYLSPMLYPSGFQFGIPGYRIPVSHPGRVVGLSLTNARKRTGLPPARFRPWLQAFGDYAFDRRPFRAEEIRAQIEAASAFGSNGWMLWNPQNIYSPAGLEKD